MPGVPVHSYKTYPMCQILLLTLFLPLPLLCACVLSCFSHVLFFVTLWTVARQAPLSMGFSTQEYWSGLPFPPQGDLPDPGIEPSSLTSPALASGFINTRAPQEAQTLLCFTPFLIHLCSD